ncbi:hypothetical protein IW138_005401 [Coemansia sp. RSA 986]|nr:hypothetical protein IW138_005401 [Coemansia sp. RSA 986]
MLFQEVPNDESTFATDGSAPLFRFGVGNMKLPVRRPPGATIMLDNRLRMGIIAVLLLTNSVPIFGRSASSRSNYLVSITVLNLAMMVVLALVQRHTIFLRPITTPSSESTDCYFDASIDETTPFTYKNDLNESYLVDTPETGSSLFDKVMVSWPTELFCRGAATGLENKDMYRLTRKYAPIPNWKRYLRFRNSNRTMFVAMLLTFIPEAILKCVYTVSVSILSYASPFFLQHILRYIENADNAEYTGTLRNAYLYVFGLLFFTMLNSVLSRQDAWISASVEMKITSILGGELSVKTLRRRGKGSWDKPKTDEKDASAKTSQSSSDEGRIVNLIGSDSAIVSSILYHVNDVFDLPISLGLGLFYIYKLLGFSALIGLCMAFLYIPLSKIIYDRVREAMKAQRLMSDKRISMITEVLQGIKAVKLFGWESRFMKNIAEQHDKQLKYSWVIFAWTVVLNVAADLMPVFVLVLILYMYTIVFGNKLTAEIAFTSLSVFNMVYQELVRIKVYFTSFAYLFVSIDRINTYLGSSHIQDLEERVASNTENMLGFECADLEWMSPEEKNNDNAESNTASSGANNTTTRVNSPATEQTPLISGESSSTPVSLTANVSSTSLAKLDDVSPFSLKGIDVQFPLGGFSIVAGPTGSGKSSLLSALIGEMTLTRGSIMVPTLDSKIASAGESKYKDIVDIANEGLALHDIAYVAQEPWLRNATIRENILFGETYEKERYEEVLRVCALKPDLRILPAGDETEIGERGVTLSGGQKQRLTLARAVYSRHRILLIDDCLSAVDAHTGRHILMECLLSRTKLMQGRTRVLITHHVPMCLPYADFMVMLSNGRVVLKGDPQELKIQGVLTSVLKEPDNNIESADKVKAPADQADDKDKEKDIDNIDETAGKSVEKDMEQTVNDIKSEDEYTKERLQKMTEQQNVDSNADLTVLQGTLVKGEEREKGQVKFEVWKMFMDMCGGSGYWVLLVCAMIVSQLFSTMKTYAIRLWVSSNDGNGPDDVASSLYFSTTMDGATDKMMHLSGISTDQAMPIKNSPAYWLSIYMLVSALGAFWGIIQKYYVCYGGIRVERDIHKKLLQTIMHATPRFFDSTPVGRIVSRFSGDMDSISRGSISNLMSWFSGFVSLATTIVIIMSVIPMFTFPAVVIVAIYAAIAYYFLPTMREIKRLRSNSRSPVVSIFSEMVHGVAVIRTFGVKRHFIKEVLNRINNNNRLRYMNLLGNQWMSLRISATSAAVTFICVLFILFNVNWIDAGLAGFVLTYATSFSSETAWVIHGYVFNEQNMNAVERVMQYLKIDQEAASESTPENKPSALWPKTGNVEIENLVAEYVPGVPVLHGISLSVRHGEKIGIVGRTGAGKSTMSLALLRFIEANEGRIMLDGVDISKIGLEDLRRNITIIPQDPVLFNGTVRYNIDPFEEYSDELIWDALRRTRLTHEQSSQATSASASIMENANTHGELALERMTGIFGSLDDEIKQNGQSLSLGQRQLVAMARALVRRSKLIVMDEATASVDFDTDERLQRTIRGYEFANSTLFCIAHRLRTIIDYDRVLVLDKGKVAEFDTPKNLLQKKNGVFRSMCEKTSEYEYLASITDR